MDFSDSQLVQTRKHYFLPVAKLSIKIRIFLRKFSEFFSCGNKKNINHIESYRVIQSDIQSNTESYIVILSNTE